MSNSIDLSKFHPVLGELQRERFTTDASELYGKVKQLFEPLEEMWGARIDAGEPTDLTPFTAGWAWDNYYGANSQHEVDLVLSGWVPTILLIPYLKSD